MLHTKFQPNIPNYSGEKVFSGSAIISNGGHLRFLTKLKIIILKPCSLAPSYKTFFMLNSTEYEIFPAYEC